MESESGTILPFQMRDPWLREYPLSMYDHAKRQKKMQVERRAFYNSIRIHWLMDPSLSVEPWQVEDYRTFSFDQLFERLQMAGISLDRTSFIAYCENIETPEDAAQDLSSQFSVPSHLQDPVYLTIFELWRRLLPEKRSLSIFCDELDRQIFLYDLGQLENLELFEDIIANFEHILEESEDQGIDSKEVFNSICQGCANNIPSFLYDLIMDQLDDENSSYAEDLFEVFSPFLQDKKRTDFIHVRLLIKSDIEEANRLLHKTLSHLNRDEPDLDFHFDILSFLVQEGDKKLFLATAKKTLPLLETEDDFRDLLTLSRDYFHCLDREEEEHILTELLEARSTYPAQMPWNSEDPHLQVLDRILKS